MEKKGIFYKLEANAENWTGYDPEIVKNTVETGIYLVDKSNKLENSLSFVNKERIALAIKWFFSFAGCAIILCGMIFGFSALNHFCETKPNELKAEYDRGYVDGQWKKVEEYIFYDIKTKYNNPKTIIDIIIEHEKNEE